MQKGQPQIQKSHSFITTKSGFSFISETSQIHRQKLFSLSRIPNLLKVSMAIFITIAFVVVFLASGTSTALADSSRRYHMGPVNIMATVLPDGSMEVNESRTFTFHGSYHAVWWEFSDLTDQHKFEVQKVELERSGSKTYQALPEVPFQTMWRTRGYAPTESYAVDIEKNAVYVFAPASNETFTVHLFYKLHNAAIRYSDTSALYWKYVGDKWENSASNINLDLTLPLPADFQEKIPPGSTIRAWGHGTHQGQLNIKNNHISAQINELNKNEFAEVRVIFPANWLSAVTPGMSNFADHGNLEKILAEEIQFSKLTAQRARNLAISFYVLLTLGILILVWAGYRAVRYGKELKPKESPKFLPEIPIQGVHPIVTSALCNFGNITSNSFLSTELVRITNMGAISLLNRPVAKKSGIFSLGASKVENSYWIIRQHGWIERMSFYYQKQAQRLGLDPSLVIPQSIKASASTRSTSASARSYTRSDSQSYSTTTRTYESASRFDSANPTNKSDSTGKPRNYYGPQPGNDIVYDQENTFVVEKELTTADSNHNPTGSNESNNEKRYFLPTLHPKDLKQAKFRSIDPITKEFAVTPESLLLAFQADLKAMDLLFNGFANKKDSLPLDTDVIGDRNNLTRVRNKYNNCFKAIQKATKVWQAEDSSVSKAWTIGTFASAVYLFLIFARLILFGSSGKIDLFLVLISILAFFISLTIRRRTQAAANLKARCDAFMRWVKEYTLVPERPPADVYIWGEIMEYAVAFDVATQASKMIQEYFPEISTLSTESDLSNIRGLVWFGTGYSSGINTPLTSFQTALSQTNFHNSGQIMGSGFGTGGVFTGGGGGGFGGGGGGAR